MRTKEKKVQVTQNGMHKKSTHIYLLGRPTSCSTELENTTINKGHFFIFTLSQS